MFSRKHTFLALVIAFILTLSVSAFAATYYVSTTGNDDNAGTQAEPWASIDNGDQKSLLVPGDTVIVEAGEYTFNDSSVYAFCEFKNCSGTANNPITYKANGEVIVANNTVHNNIMVITNFYCSGAKYLCFDGFTMKGASAAFLVRESSKYIEIKNCYITELTPTQHALDPKVTAIYIEPNGGNVKFHHNEVAYLACDTWSACVVMDMMTWPWDSGLQVVNESEYYNNIIHDFYNNTDYVDGIGGCAFWMRGHAKGAKIYNNTFFNIAQGVMALDGNEVHIKNNIFSNCKNYAVLAGGDAVTHCGNNLFDNVGTPYAEKAKSGTGDFIADPLFVDLYSDWTLAAGSPAIDAGRDMGLPYNDPLPDIGAFENNFTTAQVRIDGTITNQNGDPVGNAAVTSSNGVTTYSGQDGTYSVLLDPGSYTFTVAAAGYAGQTSALTQLPATLNFVLAKETKTYYVSPTGDDTADGLTEDTAWATIDNGDKKNLLAPGDTVIVLAGEYYLNDTVTISRCEGEEGNPITYRGEGNVITNGGYIATLWKKNFQVNKSYITIDNIKMTGNNIGVGIGSSRTTNVIIENCEIYNLIPFPGGWPSSTGVYIDPSDNAAIVRNCCIHNLTWINNCEAVGIYNMTTWDGGNGFVNTDKSLYHNNVIYNIQGTGVLFRGVPNGDLVYNNTFYNISDWGVKACNLGVPACPIVKNNIFVQMTHGALYAETEACEVTSANNLFYNVPGWGDNCINGNPLFTDAANADFTIADNSPAVNMGVDVGLPFIGPAPDMGAYETNSLEVPIGFVEGYVTDEATGSPIGGVTVSISGTTDSAITNASGYYKLASTPGNITVVLADSEDYTCAVPSVDVTIATGETSEADFVVNWISTIYYVDAVNGDDANDGSENSPWATINRGDALDILKPGDTVIVRAGEYINTAVQPHDRRIINCSGNAHFPITYKAEPGAIVTSEIDAAAVNDNTFGLWISADYLVIDGFEITGVSSAIFTDHQCVHLEVKNNIIHDLLEQDAIWPNSIAVYLGPTTPGMGVAANVHHNTIYNLPYKSSEAVAIFNMSMYWGTKGYQSRIHHNVIYNIEGAGVVARGGNQNDLVYNNTLYNVWTGISAAGGHNTGGSFSAWNNIFSNLRWNALRTEGGTCKIVANSNNLMYNCGGLIENGNLGPDNITLNPLFIDIDNADFRIADNSPAVNAGIDVGYPYIGDAPDIGAYETDIEHVVKGTLKGVVTEATDGKPIPGLEVYLVSDPDIAAVTGDDGTYSLPLDPGVYDVAVEIGGRYTEADSSATVNINGDEITTQNFTVNYTTYTYYVSVDGSDENDGRTRETAWASINRGDQLGILGPGDTVIVTEGTYYRPSGAAIALTSSGNAAYPLTYMAEGNVIVDGSPGAALWHKTLTCNGQRYVTIDGFKITGCNNLIGIATGTGNVIQNCELYGSIAFEGGMPASAGVYLEGNINNVVVRDCYIHDIAGHPNGTPGMGIYNMAAFWLGSPSTLPPARYHNNLITDIGGSAVAVRGCSGDFFYNNTVLRTSTWAVDVMNGNTIGGSAVVKNNIFMNTNGLFHIESNGELEQSNNLAYQYGQISNTAIGVDTIIDADPLLDANYRLTAGSPAIDAGCDMGLPFAGAAPDLGAFEFTAPEATDVEDIDDATALEDGTSVNFTTNLVVIAASTDFADNTFFASSEDRLAGIKCVPSAALAEVAAGDRVKVKGIVRSDADGKYIEVSEITSQTAGTALASLGMTGGALTNNVLVRVWGAVIAVGDGTLTINNGAGDVVVKLNAASTAAVGDYVSATGIATASGVQTRNANDVVIY